MTPLATAEARSPDRADPAPRHIQTWPAERFYWTVTDAPAPSPKRAAQAPPGLLEDLASDVPMPVDDLHAVAISAQGKPGSALRTVIIAAPRGALDQARREGAIAVSPESVPAFLAGHAFAPSAVNMLVGDLEPHTLRAKRTRAHLLAAGTLLVLAAMIALGLDRRAGLWNDRADQARQTLASLNASSNHDAVKRSPAQELDRVLRINQAAAQIKPPTDASIAIAQFLAAWPAKTSAKPQTLSVTASDVTLSVVVEGDPSDFLRSFKPPPGWTLDEPRINTTSGAGTAASVSRLSLRLTRQHSPAPAPVPAGSGGAP